MKMQKTQYQGPVKQGYDLNKFRKTGRHVKKSASILNLLLIMLCSIVSVNAYDYESVDYENLYIHIDNINDINTTRETLINWVWESGRYNQTPTISYKDPSTLPNLGSIDTTNVNESFDYYFINRSFTYHTYYLKNKNPNNRLFIFATGHNAGAEAGSHEMITQILNEGYDVIVKYMIDRGPNYAPVGHNDMTTIKETGFNPIEMFFNDLYSTLSYVIDNNNYQDISMTGISGGGWTTVWYSALDDRITSAYPVAGSYPRFIYDEVMSSAGDWEQGSSYDYVYDFLTENVSYLDMYILGASNGRFMNIHNRYDSCCFAGTHSNFYKTIMQNKANLLLTNYDSYITTATTHSIPLDARNLIINTNNVLVDKNLINNFKGSSKVKIYANNSSIKSDWNYKGLYYSSNEKRINFLNIIWGEAQ